LELLLPPPPQRACWEESLKGEVIMNEPIVTCTTTIVSFVWLDLGIGWAFVQKIHHFEKKLPFEKTNILFFFSLLLLNFEFHIRHILEVGFLKKYFSKK
jgi:hypothetical protein